MEPLRQTIKEGETLYIAGESSKHAFLILQGKVRLSRLLGEMEIPISLLGSGDIVAAELLSDPAQPLGYSAIAIEETTGFLLTPENLTEVMSEVPSWAHPLLYHTFMVQRIQERPERSNVATLYGVLNTMYALLMMVDRTENASQIRGPIKPILEEMQKSRSVSRYLVKPLLEAMSHVALIDLKYSDPITPLILIPDVQLFLGFLVLLQNASDLKDGLHESVFVLNPLQLSREAERVIDCLMLEEEFAGKMFEPERSIMHLPFEQLATLYSKQSGNGELLDSYHPCLKELEQHSAFTRVVDNETVSIFLNFRNLMRITIRREPNANFIDIIDFLLDVMYTTRFDHQPVRIYNQEL